MKNVFTYSISNDRFNGCTRERYRRTSKKTKTILFESSFSQNIITEILSVGVHEKHMKKRAQWNVFFLDERSFSYRCNLISKQWLSTEKMHKKLVLNVIFSMNHRFHVKLSCNYITGGKQERHKRNLRSKKNVFYKESFLHENILKTVSMRFHRKYIE